MSNESAPGTLPQRAAAEKENPINGVGANKIPKAIRPEFHALRMMIRQDMQDVLQAELGRHSRGVDLPAPPPANDRKHEERQALWMNGLPSGYQGGGPHAACSPSAGGPDAACSPSAGTGRPSLQLHEAREESEPLLSVDAQSAQLRAQLGDTPGTLSLAVGQRKSRGNKEVIADLKRLSGVGQLASRYNFEEPGLRLVHQMREEYETTAWLQRILDFAEWALQLHEPKRDGCLAKAESSRMFECIYTTIITINALFMIFQVNWDIKHPGEGPQPIMITIDRVFFGLYTIELAIRLAVHRFYFFWNADMQWNILDFSLVMYSFVEIIFGMLAGAASEGGTATWMRSLRLLRLAKVLRILRVVKAFKQLQLILNCILGSLQSMIWSVVMLAIMFYMFSLMLVQQTGFYLSESDSMNDKPTDHETLLLYFGTVQVCMWTLFKATFGGDDWAIYYAEIEVLGPLARTVWFFFVVFTQIAVLNILTGIFVENALQLADGDAQSQAMKYEEKVVDDAIELRKMCLDFDQNEDRRLNREEFLEMTGRPEFARYLKFIGVQRADMEMFFTLLARTKEKKDAAGGDDDDGDEEVVDIADFVTGCMHLKGAAQTSDLLAVMYEMQKSKQDLESSLEQKMVLHFGALKAHLKESSQMSPSSASRQIQPRQPSSAQNSGDSQ